MRIAFAGTPEFAVPSLQALIRAGHQVLMVWTQPDRPAGRKLQLMPSPVKKCALQHNLPLRQCSTWDSEAEILASLNVDVLVVAAYGQILPAEILKLPKYGGLNIHASLLPRWRGAAPVARAIAAGDQQTGVCLMVMEPTLDTGAVYAHSTSTILPLDTTGTLTARLAQLGAQLLVDELPHVPHRKPIPQEKEAVTYAKKISKEEATLEWSHSAVELERKIRAFLPSPGAVTYYQSIRLKILRAEIVKMSKMAEAGTILSANDTGLHVATGHDVLRILELQRPGARAMRIGEFLSGMSLQPGLCLS